MLAMFLKLICLICQSQLVLMDTQALPPSGNLADLIGMVFSTSSTSQVEGLLVNTTPPHVPLTSSVVSRPDASKKCDTASDCVPFYLCKDNQVIKDGTGLIDIRFDGAGCNYLETCCLATSQTQNPIMLPSNIPDGCGYRNTGGVGFKITGNHDNETEYGEFPWMVAILKEEKAKGQVLSLYLCGGSMIHPSIVLTAAHCVSGKSASDIIVRAGEWDTQTKGELYPDQDRSVREIIVHHEFSRGGLYNDISLLFVAEPFRMADNVKSVCLPPSGFHFDHSQCLATGWGKDVFGQEGRYQVILKKIELPVIPKAECQAKLRTTRLGAYFELHQSFICAGGEGKDTCKGDGGGPLICPIPGFENRYYQAGIVAWGIGCGEEFTPGVYASTSILRGWIDDMLELRNIDKSFFTP